MTLLVDSFAPFGHWSIHNIVDSTFFNSLKVIDNSINTRVFICDGSSKKQCSITRDFGNFPPDQKSSYCSLCKQRASDMFKYADETVLLTGDFRFSDINKLAFSLSGKFADEFLHLREELFALLEPTLVTHFQVNPTNLRKISPQDYSYFIDAGISYAFSLLKAWEHRLPDRLILFNTRFFPYKIAYHLAQRFNITTYVHERGITLSYKLFYDIPLYPDHYTRLCSDERVDSIFKSISPLGISRILDRALSETHAPANYTDLFDNKTRLNTLSIYEPNNYEYDLLVLLSSEDEIGSHFTFDLFQHQCNLLSACIDFALCNPDRKVIIKSHPGQSRLPDSMTLLSSICTRISDIPNIDIVMPDDKDTNIFDLIHTSYRVAGVHTTLLIYAFLIGRSVISDPSSTLCRISSIPCSYESRDSALKSIEQLFNSSDTLHPFSRDQLLFLFVYLYSNDFELGCYKLRGFDIRPSSTPLSVSSLNTSEFSDLNIITRSIVEGVDPLYSLLSSRVEELNLPLPSAS